MKTFSIKNPIWSSPLAFLFNLLWVYVVYGLCRLVFFFQNYDTFVGGVAQLDSANVAVGIGLFDTSAILYTNSLYALLMLLPLHWKEQKVWRIVSKGVYLVVNGVAIAVNMGDAVYFKYTGRRTTMSVFHEFGNESNMGAVLGREMLHHWHLVLLTFLFIFLLWRVYVHPRSAQAGRPRWAYYLVQILVLATFVPLCVGGMRGGFTTAVRPITISNANQYVNQPSEAALILNTPFSLIRTIGKKTFVEPQYFSPARLDSLYTPVHLPASDAPMRRKNVVVLIMESFGSEYVGTLNPQFEGGRYKGYTPFLDSLIAHSLTFEHSFGNGRKSIDGMPSVLSSIPMFVEPFFLTPASLNHLSGLAGELRKEKYHTAFFHGAENGSMGFQAFAKATGFQEYYGRTEFNADSRFRGDKDFDGTWAIWDAPFLQFYAQKMSELPQPFMTSVFTASSHAPYAVPSELAAQFPEEGGSPLHKCVRYADEALRQFFETARKQSWYKNTLFVITADHTSISTHPEYQTSLGVFRVPIVFFDPSGEIAPERRKGIAQQIDIMPTVLGHLGYPRPFIAFGNDLFRTAPEATFAVAYENGFYLFTQGNYVLTFDGTTTKSIHNFVTDSLCRQNLLGHVPQQTEMEQRLKAIIQSYMSRMINDQVALPNERSR